MRFLPSARIPLAAVAAGAVLAGMAPVTAWAEPGPTAPPATASAANTPAPDRVPPADRSEVLGDGWEKSQDIAWTTTGDAQGFHLLTATEQSGYAWKTLASLAEPGFDADQWIGNACVTGSGKRAVVVYAPRTFTNDTRLMARGGFTAVVDLTTGAVTKLKLNASLSYYNPGCGADEEAVLTQSPGEDRKQTRLFRVNAATGAVSEPVVVDGQITSSVPAGGGRITAASGRTLVEIDGKGAKKRLATTGSVPYRISKDNDGGYVFLERVQRDSLQETETALVRRWTGKKVTELGRGRLADAGLARVGGQVYLTGEVTTQNALPKSVTRLTGVRKDATLSTKGTAVVQHTVWADGLGSPKYLQREEATDARPVTIDTTLRDTGKNVGFTVTPMEVTSPEWETSRTPSPLLGTARGGSAKGGTADGDGLSTQSAGTRALTAAATAASGSGTETVESERTCSVPRNDPRNQAMQPKPRQVEWAVDKAITGKLNIGASRPANWKSLGMPAYAPQTLFPNPVLDGGGRVPAQVMLGITAQESNMWQASRSAVPGVTGSPLIGNYYGVDYYDGNPDNDWDVNWSKADCGYGITQVTDHMRMAGRENGKGGTAWDYQKQRAVALDYAANVAAGLGILVEKWNQTKSTGLVVHDGNPAKLENWFFALWAYNSGFYENVNANGPWGVGWANNPANPEWDAGRLPFMETRLGDEDASAAARPQHWPYPEKVLGFAAHPPSFLESPGTLVAAFRAAWWNGTTEDATIQGSAKSNRAKVKPPEDLFCGPYNWCEPSKISDTAKNEPGQGPCTRDDFQCWFHLSVQWKTDCSYSCGNELFRFTSPDYDAEQADGTAYAPNCTRSGLPAGALIVDDVPGGTPSIRPGCANSDWTNAGSFTADFGSGESGIALDGTATTVWPGKIDLHQLGAGFGGHFSFGHTRDDDVKGNRLNFTGTWTLAQERTDWMRVLVHLPDHGAHTQQAKYDIDTGGGYFDRHRYVNQKRGTNGWMSLGAYRMNGVPRVRLTTETEDGTGDDDVAFDAVAFQPLAGKPQQVVQMGDSYTSGEGAGSYAKETDNDVNVGSRWNACRRSANSWVRKTTLPGRSASIGALADGFSSELELQNVSCSGARSWQMDTGNAVDDNGNEVWGVDGNFHERFQIDSGVLSGDTDLVTLTVGGNDAGFPDVMEACATTGCPAEADVHKDIDDAMAGVEDLLRKIHTEASQAKIVLLGYPQLFNENSLTCVSGVGGAGMIRINDNGVYMEGKQRAVVDKLKAEGLPVFFESSDGDFEGRRACDSPEGINKIVTAGKGPGDFTCNPNDPSPWTWCVSRESYHPNTTGTTAYSQAFRRAVDNLPK